MLVLLPPSEGKTAAVRGRLLDLDRLSSPSLTPARTQVLDALLTLSTGDPGRAAQVLDLPPTRLDLLAVNAALRTAPTARADRVYSGVLYDALALADLDPAARRRAATRVLITSSLFGVVRPTDRIPAYRLSGGVALPGVGPVAGVWRKALGPALVDAVGGGSLVDLRSSMYAAFWRPGADLARRTATVRVLHELDGKRSVVSHFNKATKGRIVKALLESGATARTPSSLAETLRDLGWTVEVVAGARGATQLDVVVTGSL